MEVNCTKPCHSVFPDKGDNYQDLVSFYVYAFHLSPVLDEYFDDDVGELDVHDRRHRLLLRPEQRRAEADAKIGDGHHVPLAVGSNLVVTEL